MDFSRGIAVEIAHIDRELKKLWETESEISTRASLMNLAVYCEGVDKMEANTELIAKITQDHACRALIISTDPKSSIDRVQAWISAHCHMSRAGAKQVCCEQISFLLEGSSRKLITSIIFSHLDSDLPLYLWWQGEFPDQIEERLWTSVDRLIFDSRSWINISKQFNLLHASIVGTESRLCLCDLNWTRLLYLRQALAQMFDIPVTMAELAHIETVTVTHAPGYRSTAMLLVGWLMAQLNWKLTKADPTQFSFKNGSNKNLDLVLIEKQGSFISACSLSSQKAAFKVVRQKDSNFLHVETHFSVNNDFQRLLPAGGEDILNLINQELMHGGKHQVYLKALDAAETLLER